MPSIELPHDLHDQLHSHIKDAGISVEDFIRQSLDATSPVANEQSNSKTQTNEMLYRVLSRNMPKTGVMILDRDLRYVLAEGAGLAATGFPSEEIEGKLMIDVIPSEVYEFSKPLLDAAFAGEESELTFPSEEDKFYRVMYLPLQNGGQIEYAMIMVTDISDIQRAAQWQQERTKLEQALEREQALFQQRQKLMFVISHELRTPLTLISNAVQFLTIYRDRITPEREAEKFAALAEQVTALTGLLDEIAGQIKFDQDFLEYRPQVVDVAYILSDFVTRLMPLATGNHTIKLTSDIDNLQVSLDERLMYHAISNLISNAIKYSPDGGTVTVSASTHDNALVISVQDEGIGISADDQANIFNPFERGNNVGNIRGTGMGLAIVRDIARLHGGTVHLKSQPDTGTTVTITLPIA